MTTRVVLNSLGQVSSELGRIYRQAKSKRMPWQDAVAAAKILREIRCCLTVSKVEMRMVELEKMAEQALGERANGGARSTSNSEYYYRQ